MPNSNVKKCEHLLINIRFWETAYLPLPWVNICPRDKWKVSVNAGPWEGGVGGQLPGNIQWSTAHLPLPWIYLPTTGEECALDNGLWPTDAPGETDPADEAAAKSAWRRCKAFWLPGCRELPCWESCCCNWRISCNSCICCSWVDCGEGRSSWLCVCEWNTSGKFKPGCALRTGCTESQFYSLPFGQAVASMY